MTLSHETQLALYESHHNAYIQFVEAQKTKDEIALKVIGSYLDFLEQYMIDNHMSLNGTEH